MGSVVEDVKNSVRVENDEGGNVIAESNFANDGSNSQVSNPKPKYCMWSKLRAIKCKRKASLI